METLFTTKQIAEKLKVSEVTIWRWRKEGLPYKKLGTSIRFSEHELMAWLKEKEEE